FSSVHVPRIEPDLSVVAGNDFRPTFKLLKREKRAGKTVRIYELQPKTPVSDCGKAPTCPRPPGSGSKPNTAVWTPSRLKKALKSNCESSSLSSAIGIVRQCWPGGLASSATFIRESTRLTCFSSLGNFVRRCFLTDLY